MPQHVWLGVVAAFGCGVRVIIGSDPGVFAPLYWWSLRISCQPVRPVRVGFAFDSHGIRRSIGARERRVAWREIRQID